MKINVGTLIRIGCASSLGVVLIAFALGFIGAGSPDHLFGCIGSSCSPPPPWYCPLYSVLGMSTCPAKRA